MKTNLSLKQTWTALILFAIIVPVTLAMLWYGQTLYQDRLSNALLIERQANEQLRNQIESEINRFKTLLKNKSDPLSLLLDRKDNPTALRDINSLLRNIVEREQGINEVIILSKQADVIAFVDPGIGITGDKLLSTQKLRSAALHWGFDKSVEYPEIVIPSLGRIYMGAPRKHEDFIAFSIAVPIGKPVKAVLVALIDAEKLWLTDKHKEHGIGVEKTRDYILDRRGALITKIDDSEYKPGDLMTHMEIARTALSNGEWSTDISYIGVINQPVYGTLTTIPSLSWTLISEVIASKIIQPIWASLLQMFLLTLLGMIIFAWFVLRLASKTLRPIQHVCEAIDQVARGDYQFALKPSGISELDMMTAGFNNMAKARQDAELLIWEREQNLAITLNSIGDAVITTDAKGHVTRMNPVAEKLTGWSFQEAAGQPLKTIFPIVNASTREPIENPVEKVLATGETVYLSNHTTLIAKDGTEYQIADSAAPIRNGDDHILGMVLIFNNVTEEYRMREEIRSSAQHLKLYREQTPLAAIEWSTDFKIIDWNHAAEEIFGYTLDEVKGRYFADFMLPDNVVIDIKTLWKDLISQTGGTKSINENLTKDGNIILCEWHNTPLKDESGTVIGAASLVLDITAQHKTQQALLVKEQEQREILNHMLDAVITIDETGNIISFNKTAETLFGYSFEEVVGQNVSRLMPEPHSSQHDGYLQRYLKTGDAHIIGYGREVEGQHKNKQTFPMRLSVAELPADESGKRRFIGTCQNLTFIKQQEEQLRRTQKMDALGKLTGGIAHDYNNMLGVILGYSDLLESMLTDQPKLANYANQIHHAGERGAKLTKKLLSFSRQENPEAAKLDINALLQEQQDMLKKTLTVRIKLLVELGDEVWPIWLDNSDLEDAILNMSINAMHAMNDMDSGAQLTIRTSNQSLNTLEAQRIGLTAGDYVQLSLTDTGSGMDELTKEKIFDPFFSTKGEKGTGLGLSQVFGFVKRAGGTISVYSEPGHGSEFMLYFPRYLGADIKSTAETSEDVIDLSGKEKILIVDDEAALRDLVSELLSQQGYQIFCAENGKQALNILEHEHIDLMLSDVIMPEMDGYQLATIVQEKYPAIKIQLASGFSDDRHVSMSDDILHKNLLHKPYQSATLLKKIRELLD